MANEQHINYKAVLADLEAKKVQIESAIAAIKMIAAQGGNITGGGALPSNVEAGVFLKMSIPDATKKLLEITRQKQSTQAVIDALELGGLPKSKYTTVWGILSRRAKKVGDLINMQGDWALAEWYPNYRKPKDTETKPTKKPSKAAARRKPAVAAAKAEAVKRVIITPPPMAASA